MSIIEMFLFSTGVAMDATAVSICKGYNERGQSFRNSLLLPFLFGVFQFIMPLIGWAIGESIEAYISPYDSWLACILLVYIGANMIYDGYKKEYIEVDPTTNWKERIILAFATSIDALAVGASLAFIPTEPIILCASMGIVTFLLSAIGLKLGEKAGVYLGQRAEYIGGAVLCLLGVKILIS